MEYLELQQVAKFGSTITEIRNENNRLYFKMDGHQFQTFGNYVYHSNHPLYDSPFTDYLAEQNNTAEGIEAGEQSYAKAQKEVDLFDKHKTSIYKLIFLRGLEILADKGEEAFVFYIDHHLDIMENDGNCQVLIKLLEEQQ